MLTHVKCTYAGGSGRNKWLLGMDEAVGKRKSIYSSACTGCNQTALVVLLHLPKYMVESSRCELEPHNNDMNEPARRNRENELSFIKRNGMPNFGNLDYFGFNSTRLHMKRNVSCRLSGGSRAEKNRRK